jgi:arabinose-5-phosphate isomerase
MLTMPATSPLLVSSSTHNQSIITYLHTYGLNMDVKQSMQEILRAESEAILNIPVTDAYEKAVETIVEHVNRRGGKLVTSGMGKAGQIAMNIATTFASTGTPAIYLHPSEAQHGDLGILQPNDLMLLISNSGKTREILELVQLTKGLYADMPMIVITGAEDSELAHLADVTLPTGGAPEVCPLGLTPTTSTTMMTVIGDILVVNVMQRIGFSRADYAKRHHGGYLGSAARGETAK